jgi:hypothetical protein
MSIDTATGKLTGTPREEGTHTITISVTDTAPKTISVDVTFTVLASKIPALVLDLEQTVGQSLDVATQAKVTGGWGTKTWSLKNAPAWLSISSSTGSLSGTIGDEVRTRSPSR